MIKSGFKFDVEESQKFTTPFLWACYHRDLATIKILVEDGKITLSKKAAE
jgi:hypothetical protein